MKSKLNIIAAVAALAATALLLTGCGASETNTAAGQSPSPSAQSDTGGAKPSGNNRGLSGASMTETYDTALKDLVAAGTITQDQSDKVMEALKSTGNQSGQTQNGTGGQNSPSGTQQGTQSAGGSQRFGGERQNALKPLVTNGVLTQAQADAISQKVREISMSAVYEPVLKKLVTDGTITQDQSDKVLAALTSGAPSSASGNSTQSPAPGGQQRQNRYGFDADALKTLVSGGVMTQTQADAVTKALTSAMQGGQHQGQKQNGQTGQSAGSGDSSQAA